jgi:hypothetical protein
MPRISIVVPRHPRRSAELVSEGRVNPERTAQWGNATLGAEGAPVLRSAFSGSRNFPNRRIRTRTSGGVGGDQRGSPAGPYPDSRAPVESSFGTSPR